MNTENYKLRCIFENMSIFQYEARSEIMQAVTSWFVNSLKLGNHFIPQLTNVKAISVIILPTLGEYSMRKNSQLLKKTAVWSTGVRKLGNW